MLAPAPAPAADEAEDDGTDPAADFDDTEDPYDEEGDDFADVVRLACPDCGRPIAVVGDDSVLPSHAVCPNPWQPFGLTVCAGSGRAVADAGAVEPLVLAPVREQPTAPLPLDWRTQPFSHVGGPGSRPVRVPVQRAPHTLAA
ncbi:hypothetical protein RVR_1016 [Actinacidiphila reveromycinica]|uniref:Uncharacterized protein n=1 Tax=Actinacidiphila reveromycinica TaxID=659352 RepID=A0A7U3VLW1_9ACTN|nr:hypothetical protein RVR_1016 [Streptomyces sp. SN-593]